jgi:hypothetical protein
LVSYSSQEIVSKSINLLVPQDRSGEMITILAAARGAVADFETTRIHQDGTLFPASRPSHHCATTVARSSAPQSSTAT